MSTGTRDPNGDNQAIPVDAPTASSHCATMDTAAGTQESPSEASEAVPSSDMDDAAESKRHSENRAAIRAILKTHLGLYTLKDQVFMLECFNHAPELVSLVDTIVEGKVNRFDRQATEYRIYKPSGKYVSIDVRAERDEKPRGKICALEIHPDSTTAARVEGRGSHYLAGLGFDADVSYDWYDEQPEVTLICAILQDVYGNGKIINKRGYGFDMKKDEGPAPLYSLIVLNLKANAPPLTDEEMAAEDALVAEAGGLLDAAPGREKDRLERKSLAAWLAHDFLCERPEDMHFARIREVARFLKETPKGEMIMVEALERLIHENVEASEKRAAAAEQKAAASERKAAASERKAAEAKQEAAQSNEKVERIEADVRKLQTVVQEHGWGPEAAALLQGLAKAQ